MPVVSHPEHGAAGKGLTCLVRFANLPADASEALGGFASSTTLPWFALFPVLGWPWRSSLVDDDVEFAAQGPLPQNTRITGTMQLIAASPKWCLAFSIRGKGGHGIPAQNYADPSQPDATNRTYPNAHGDVGRGYYDGKNGPEYDQMFYQSFLASAPMAVFRVGVSREAWETVASQQPDRAGSSRFDRYGCDWTVVFDKAESRGAIGGTQVKLKTTLAGYEAFNVVTQRLVAVTSDGNEHATKLGEGDWKRGRTIIYDLPLSSIKEFRFQVSPYDWVEFRNVSLRPGQKTLVTIMPLDGA